MIDSPCEGLRYLKVRQTLDHPSAEGMSHAIVDGEGISIEVFMVIFVQPRLETCRGPGYSETGADIVDTASSKPRSCFS